MMNLWRIPTLPYRDLAVRCAPGVHDACLELLRSSVPTTSRILDLASGSGAFLAKLQDAGFADLLGVERDVSSYQLRDVPCLALDLDRAFAPGIGGAFDVITAIEIIEHLANPIAFLTEITRLLSPNGLALISTPNAAEWQSRLKFLLTGRLRYFDEQQYRFQRHISPIFPALVPFMLEEAGLQLVSLTTAGSFDGFLRRMTLGAAGSALSLVMRDRTATGECLIIIARRAAAVHPVSQ